MKAVILTPYHEKAFEKDLIYGADLIICADSAYVEARRHGIAADVIIGDFDHDGLPAAEGGNVITVPSEKDDTDTMLCIKYAIDAGTDEIIIAGGIGGRLDHTVANLQSLAYAQSHGVKASITDGQNTAYMISKAAMIPYKPHSYLSLFAYGGAAGGVSVSGVRYPLDNAELTADFPLGVSNEIVDDFAKIEVKSGRLLIVQSQKDI